MNCLRTVCIRATLAVGVLLLPGCDRSEPSTSADSSAKKSKVVSNNGTYTVLFETVPAPIPMNSPFTLRFTVEANGANPGPSDLGVEVDARMPAHFHGMNRVPKVTRRPDGSFEADGMLFHMPGHWELYFDITRAGRTERAQADVDLK